MSATPSSASPLETLLQRSIAWHEANDPEEGTSSILRECLAKIAALRAQFAVLEQHNVDLFTLNGQINDIVNKQRERILTLEATLRERDNLIVQLNDVIDDLAEARQ